MNALLQNNKKPDKLMITRHIVISTCQIKQTFDLVLTYNWLLVQAYNLFFKCNAFLLIIKNKLQAKEKYKYEKVVIGEKVILLYRSLFEWNEKF